MLLRDEGVERISHAKDNSMDKEDGAIRLWRLGD